MTVHTCKPSSLYERYFEYADTCVRVRLCPDVYSGVASELAVVGLRCAVKGDWKSYGLMERVLAEAAGDVPVDSSYDDICKFILLSTVSVNTSRHYSFKFCD